jgi:peroxiredoxin-like protein
LLPEHHHRNATIMQDLPHHYQATALASADSHVALKSGNMPEISTAAPAEFGGPGDLWSPEHLLVGTVANCFILTFRAIARNSRLEWIHLECSPVGVLERIEKITRFTKFTVNAKLTVPAGTDAEKALRLLHRAEAGCLITRSLQADVHLVADIIVEL